MGVETFYNTTVEQNIYRTMTVGEIVSNDFRTASIFKNAGIDYCCEGNETLEKVCKDNKLDLSAIESSLKELEPIESNSSHNFNEWDADVLCDYIVNSHHQTISKSLPKLCIYTETIADIHGFRYPELLKISMQFTKISIELTHHIAKEEKVLFPAIKNALHMKSSGSKCIIVSEIKEMKKEHEYIGSALDYIKDVSKNYSIPPNTSIIHKLTYKFLEQFDADMHTHFDLENNILFPKALELAK